AEVSLTIELSERGRLHRQDHHAAETAIRGRDPERHGHADFARNKPDHRCVDIQRVVRVVDLGNEEGAVDVVGPDFALAAGDDVTRLVHYTDDREERFAYGATTHEAFQVKILAVLRIFLANERGHLLGR